jgi:SAM-dependent methyltransferase
VGVGVDVSSAMLEVARRDVPDRSRLFVQGDAVRLPLADAAFDTVFMLGGIHHVNDRAGLFAELRRILRPGGRFLWREPVDDFGPWRWLRRLVYHLSPTLQEDTEHPLRRGETERQLRDAGFRVTCWRTLGFLAYCVLMNSDVLVVNRVFQYVPGIGRMTRAAARFDALTLRTPGLGDAGLIVVGSAVAGA